MKEFLRTDLFIQLKYSLGVLIIFGTCIFDRLLFKIENDRTKLNNICYFMSVNFESFSAMIFMKHGNNSGGHLICSIKFLDRDRKSLVSKWSSYCPETLSLGRMDFTVSASQLASCTSIRELARVWELATIKLSKN